jgi:hypothetical protein
MKISKRAGSQNNWLQKRYGLQERSRCDETCVPARRSLRAGPVGPSIGWASHNRQNTCRSPKWRRKKRCREIQGLDIRPVQNDVKCAMCNVQNSVTRPTARVFFVPWNVENVTNENATSASKVIRQGTEHSLCSYRSSYVCITFPPRTNRFV